MVKNKSNDCKNAMLWQPSKKQKYNTIIQKFGDRFFFLRK